MSEPVSKPQEEPWEDPFPSKRPSRWFVRPIVLLIFYVLSVGPACILVKKGYMTKATLRKIYFPIAYLCEASPATGRFVEGYANLWTE